MLMIGGEMLARAVHKAWLEGMIGQGREVAPERMAWDTLSDQDKLLDKYIGVQLARIIVEAMGATTPGEKQQARVRATGKELPVEGDY